MEDTGLLDRLPAWLGDALIVGAIVLGSLFPGPSRPLLPYWTGPHPLVSISLLMIASIIFVLIRHDWPMVALLGTLLAFVLATRLYVNSIGPGIALVICAYTLAERWPRRRAFAASATVVTLLLTLSMALANWDGFDIRVFTVGAAVAFAAALGDSDRNRREYLDEVLDRAEHAEQTREAEAQRRVTEERLRIARDLHDTVAHQISVISLNAGVASAGTTDPRAQAALANIRTASRSALSEISALLKYLRTDEADEHPRTPSGIAASPDTPPSGAVSSNPDTAVQFGPPSPPVPRVNAHDVVVAPSGIVIGEGPPRTPSQLPQHAPQPGLANLGELTDGVECVVDGDLTRVTGPTDVAAFRVIQEALTNARKHGTGTPLLQVSVEGDLELRVENRRGTVGVGTGFGLIGIRERVAALGGTVETGPDGDRYVLTAHLPLTRET